MKSWMNLKSVKYQFQNTIKERKCTLIASYKLIQYFYINKLESYCSPYFFCLNHWVINSLRDNPPKKGNHQSNKKSYKKYNVLRMQCLGISLLLNYYNLITHNPASKSAEMSIPNLRSITFLKLISMKN